MFALKMYLSFIYTIYHLSKAANHFPFVKVAATLVITPQGARKTIARQTAEKVLEMTAASHLNYLLLYLLMSNRQNRAALLKLEVHTYHKHRMHVMANSRCVVAFILINTLYCLTFQIHISSLFPQQAKGYASPITSSLITSLL